MTDFTLYSSQGTATPGEDLKGPGGQALNSQQIQRRKELFLAGEVMTANTGRDGTEERQAKTN